jgi:hypothetical protein
MSDRPNDLLTQYGFRFGTNGLHAAWTMMLDDLKVLLAAVPQEADVRDRIDGARQRLAAAQDVKRRLELILEGEPPYDIFVRWKKLFEQPIGWNPDLNDGVRLNIGPFMTAKVLSHNKKPKLNITWDKDRGKDVERAPWFKVFKVFKVFNGDRINYHHLTVAEKRAARAKAGGS